MLTIGTRMCSGVDGCYKVIFIRKDSPKKNGYEWVNRPRPTVEKGSLGKSTLGRLASFRSLIQKPCSRHHKIGKLPLWDVVSP